MCNLHHSLIADIQEVEAKRPGSNEAFITSILNRIVERKDKVCLAYNTR